MRNYLAFFSVIALLFVAGCKDKAGETYGFETSFATIGELQNWAKTSTPDTGRFHQLEFKDKKIMLVYRSHDEMARHSDLGVYQEKGGSWHLIKAYPPTEEGIFEAKVYINKLEFHYLGKPDDILLKITEEDLL